MDSNLGATKATLLAKSEQFAVKFQLIALANFKTLISLNSQKLLSSRIQLKLLKDFGYVIDAIIKSLHISEGLSARKV